MKIAAISDTHNNKFNSIPDADILVHAGDFSSKGYHHEVVNFKKHLTSLPHKHKVFIAGNHDFYCQDEPEEAKNILHKPDDNIHYLLDSGVEIEGIKFWGSPWQPVFFNWAFNLSRGSSLQRKWDLIPDDTDILITHGPPYGYCDLVYGERMEHVGCDNLTKTILERVKPKYHIFGHIHGSWGIRQYQGTMFINASFCNELYQPIHDHIVIDTDKKSIEIVDRNNG